MAELFANLESNDVKKAEEAKKQLRELCNKDEPWVVYGLYDYYLSTNSIRIMDFLANIKEPHQNHLFDKISNSLKSQRHDNEKVQALTLLGHVARCQPTWLYKLPSHNLMQEVLKLLKNENDLLPLISALLALIVLLPMLPSAMSKYLNDIFDIFRRLAAWNADSDPSVEDQMIHLQLALYALFIRLYGMYPCNLIAYLQSQYKDRSHPIFVHTIKPMLVTVRFHPSLVTVSREYETATERWKKMGVHDVIVECERFSLDLTDRCPHDTCQFSSGFRSRSGTSNSTMEKPYNLQSLKHLPSPKPSNDGNFFSPSHVHNPPETSHEGTSPPEAAIEATPETTPDVRLTPRPQPINSNVARALTSFTSKSRLPTSLTTTPTHSQPSSPMRKDFTQFNFPQTTVAQHQQQQKESLTNQKLQLLMRDRSEATTTVETIKKPPPSSPLKILQSAGGSGENRAYQRGSQDKNDGSSGDETKSERKMRRCDSIHDDCDSLDFNDEQEHGSPCTEGGLHMPNSASMTNFAKNMRRLRYHSQCNPEPEKSKTSTGSSPGTTFQSNTVRRANSCPEIKKSPILSKENKTKPLDETDEELSEDNIDARASNGIQQKSPAKPKLMTSITTQTENLWPMPYEHLFLEIYPSLENNDIKPSPAPSPAPFNVSQEKHSSFYEVLDKYIETAVACSEKEKDSIQNLKNEIRLMHQQLLFERHRRETHAYRNRRLLADAKSTRLLEECKSALRDQVRLLQREIDALHEQLNKMICEKSEGDRKLVATAQYWENQYKISVAEKRLLQEKNENLDKQVRELKLKCQTLETEKQQVESNLLDAITEVNIAREQAWAGERGRAELECVNKELLLIGELQLKYQEKLNQLSSIRNADEELRQLKEAYNAELKTLNHQLEHKIVNLEACQVRVSELEHEMLKYEETISQQKRKLRIANEEHHEKLLAVESKYKTQLTINRALEEKILELRQRSPDTSSCHEVNATTTTAGLSTHSSPLSASLASSEGSLAFQDKEVKNLQAFVDQRDGNSRARTTEEIELHETDGQIASSSRTD